MGGPPRGLPHVPDPWQEPPVPTIDGQHRLFDLPDDERGFRGPVAAQAAGITYLF